MQIAVRCCPVCSPARCRLGGAGAGGDGPEDGVEPGDGLGLAADHEAVAAVKSPDAARGSAIQVMNAARSKLRCTGDVVAVVGVAAVDDRVVRVEELGQLIEGGLYDGGRQHEPSGPWPIQLRHQVAKRAGGDRALALQLPYCAFVEVIDHTVVAVAHEPAHEVRAHPAESDHAELHGGVGSHGCSPVGRGPSVSGRGNGG